MKERKIIKRIICVIFALCIAVCGCRSVDAGIYNAETLREYLGAISLHQKKTVKSPQYGSVGGEWTVMGLARYGTITKSYIQEYKSALKKKLDECSGVLSQKKYTDYARVAIALSSIEENPADFYGYNLLKTLAELENVMNSGITGAVYTLIAFDCGQYEIPEPDADYTGKKTTRGRLIEIILSMELDGGGWCMAGKSADTDVTAMTIQALAPYCDKDEEVNSAVQDGLSRLSELQKDDGGYATVTGTQNCESTAQVLAAMAAANINVSDKRFIKKENNVIDGLLAYYQDGGFRHIKNTKVNQMATDQAMYALTAYYRYISGMNRLYDMRDGISYIHQEEAESTRTEKKTNENMEQSKDKSAGLKSGAAVKHKKKKSGGKSVGGKAEKKEETKQKEPENISESQRESSLAAESESEEFLTSENLADDGEAFSGSEESTGRSGGYKEEKLKDNQSESERKGSWQKVITAIIAAAAVGAYPAYRYLRKKSISAGGEK